MPLSSPRIRIAALGLAAFLALGAQDGDLAERLFRSGERAYGAKSYSEALETWGQLLQQAPKSPFCAQALLRMARHQLEVEGKPEAALPLLERLKTDYIKTPVAADAMLMRGRILAAQARKPQDLREAIGEFNRLVDLFPDHPAIPEARYQLGLAARLQGQWVRALQHFTEVLRQDPTSPVAPMAQLQAAELLDGMGDLQGCLGMLQGIRTRFPQSPEAQEAEWRIAVRVKQRLQRPPLKSEGPWPAGKTKWLKTPTLLATDSKGGLFIYQDDLDRAFALKGSELVPVGTVTKNAKAMTVPASGLPWLVSAKAGVTREEGAAPLAVPNLSTPTGAFLDGWQNLWVSDAKAASITLVTSEGASRSLPSPAAAAMAALPTGGAVVASDATAACSSWIPTGSPGSRWPTARICRPPSGTCSPSVPMPPGMWRPSWTGTSRGSCSGAPMAPCCGGPPSRNWA